MRRTFNGHSNIKGTCHFGMNRFTPRMLRDVYSDSSFFALWVQSPCHPLFSVSRQVPGLPRGQFVKARVQPVNLQTDLG